MRQSSLISKNINGVKMTYTAAPRTESASVNRQFLHLEAAELHEKAVEHHRQAASLHDVGDSRQADMHGDIAYSHAMKAAKASGRALKVTPRWGSMP